MGYDKKEYKLKKTLRIWELSFYGIGVILGAGIYAVIGESAGIAGNAVWISFIIAATLASLTGMSYAELSSMFPKTAAEYNYTKKAFRIPSFSFVVGFLMVVAGIASSVAVSLAFAGYFNHLFGGAITLIAVGLLAVMTFINYVGIKESARFNILSTLIEIIGLLIVIAAGIFFYSNKGLVVNLMEVPVAGGALFPILGATALIFFAYIGFEDLVNVSEESEHARRDIPKAIIISIVVSTILYILVAFSAINILGWEALSASGAPLTSVVASVFPWFETVFSFIALFATANTSLIIMIVASRIMYGMAKDSAIPEIFGKIGKRHTPYISVLIIGIVSIILAIVGNLKSAALLTDFVIFFIYTSVNSSLIVLRYKRPDIKRSFKTPLNIGNFPILAFLGLITSIGMFFFFDYSLLLIGGAVVLTGFVTYGIINVFQKRFP